MHQNPYEDPRWEVPCPVKPTGAIAVPVTWRTQIHWKRADFGKREAYKYPFLPQDHQDIFPNTHKHHHTHHYTYHNAQPSLNFVCDISVLPLRPQPLFQINVLNSNMFGQGSSNNSNNGRINERMPGQWTSFNHSFHQPQETEDTGRNAASSNDDSGFQNYQDAHTSGGLMFAGSNQAQGMANLTGTIGPEHGFLDHGIAGGYVERGQRVGGSTAGEGFGGMRMGVGLFGRPTRPRGAARQPGLGDVAEEDAIPEHQSSGGMLGSRPDLNSSAQYQRHEPSLVSEGYEGSQRTGIFADRRRPYHLANSEMTRPRVSLARRRTANESSQGQGPRNTGAPNAAVTINASSVNGNTINVSPPSNSNTTDNSGGVRLSYRTENRRRRRSSTPPEVEGLRTSSSEVAVETPQRPARRARYSSPTVDHVLQPQSRPASQPAPILRPFAPTRVRPDPPTTTEVPRQSATSAALLSVLDTPRPVHQPSATSRVLESILNTHIPTAPGATPIRWAASIPGVPEHRPTADEFVEMHRRQELWASGNPVRTPFTRHELHNRRMQNMEYWRIEQHQEQFVNRPPVPPIVTEERRGRRVPILQTQPLVQPSPNYRFPRMGPRLTAAQMRPHRPEGWTRPRVINLRNETPYDRMEFYENERRAKEDKDRRRLEAQQPGLRPPPNLLPDTPEGFANLRWAVEQGSRENVTMQLLEQVRAREEANRASFSGAFETFRRKMEAETKLERDEERTAERHASLHRDEDVALARDLREQRALQNAASGAEALEELRLEASMVWWEAAETAREREARRTGWIRVAADAARAASERIVERSARNRMNQLEAERRERARRTIEAYERRSRAANCQG